MNRIAKPLVSLLLCWPLAGCPGDDTPRPSPPEDWHIVHEGLEGVILSFWGNSISDLFAVGGSVGNAGRLALVLHYDGTQWTKMEADAPTLWWAQGFGADDVWAVGERGIIMHFDGAAWTPVVDEDAGYTLWGIWGATPDDVWAVGGTASGGQPGVVRHYDGTSWQDVPGVGIDDELLFKVWGTAADDVYIVGTGGAIIHYDGSSWTRMESPVTDRLLTVRGRAPDDIYAVGGLSAAVVLHYDGSAWSQVALETEPGGLIGQDVGGLMGVWTAPSQPVVASGIYGTVMMDSGDGWQLVESQTARDIHGVWGSGDGRFVGGGGRLYETDMPDGVVVGLGDVGAGPVTTWTP